MDPARDFSVLMGSQESERRPEFPKMSRVAAGKPGDGVRAHFVQNCYLQVSRALDGEEHRFTHPYSEVHLTGSPCLSTSQGSKHQGPFHRGVDTAPTMLSKAWPLPWLRLEFRGGGSSRCPRRKRSGGTHRRTLALGPLSLACISKR